MPEHARTAVAVSEAVAQGLVDSGIDCFFGLMGDDTAAIAAALVARNVSYHDARHENGAVAMAAAYSSASGRLGACVISRGPGITNALTAVVNSSRGESSVLIVVGDTWVDQPLNTVALPDYKALDVSALAGAIGLPLFRPTGSRTVMQTLEDAIACARRGRTVVFAVPRDVASGEVPAADVQPHNRTGPVDRLADGSSCEPARARPEAVALAADVLAGASRPLVIAGRGAWRSGARAAIDALVDRVGAVVATTLGAKGMFSGHPYDVGLVGSFSHTAGRRLMEQADCLVVVGASLNRFSTVTGTALPAVPLIQIDRQRGQIGANHWADVGLVGDARAVVGQLLEVLDERDPSRKPFHAEQTRRELAAFEPSEDFEDEGTVHTLDPRTLLLELDAVLPADRSVVTDVGNFFGFVPPHVSAIGPDHFLLSSNFSAIGLGLSTALGVAVARPGSCTVAFVGDGGLLMSLGELESLARQQLPVVVVVMNDGSYGAERHFLRVRQLPDAVTVFPRTDFADIAAAWGMEARTVRSVAEVRALGPLLADVDGPVLLDCRVNSDVVAPFLSGG